MQKKKRILVIGAGFAGMWSALAAMRLIDRAGATAEIEVAVLAPEPVLAVRPRLYEAGGGTMSAPLGDLFRATGIRFIGGRAEVIRTADRAVEIVDATGARSLLLYDRLILAAGSQLVRPNVPGLRDHALSIDQLGEAAQFEAHLKGLASRLPSQARNTAVVAGGGFTGIEIAAELPSRLRSILGNDTDVRVFIVEQADEIGPDLGPGPRPVITQALNELGVESRLGAAVASIDAGGVVTSRGERIDALTVVWTAGMQASPLTKQIPGEKDKSGRLYVDRNLRVPSCPDVFASGDAAYAATDEAGHHAMMSCQHAMRLGRSAGNNAAADVLNVATLPYSQQRYGTCLDLGPWGAVVTEGWDRTVQLAGPDAKAIKQQINGILIYPPKADRAEALAAADPVDVPVDLRTVQESP